jgi:hypothetical protein
MRDIDRALQRADLAATDLLLALREAQSVIGNPVDHHAVLDHCALVAIAERASGLKSDLYKLASAIGGDGD